MYPFDTKISYHMRLGEIENKTTLMGLLAQLQYVTTVHSKRCAKKVVWYKPMYVVADVEEPLGKTKKIKMKRDKSKGRAAKMDETPLCKFGTCLLLTVTAF